ncbi:MAG: biotin/lipoate A/B protein ligase family protein [Acidobacteriota bacterium]
MKERTLPMTAPRKAVWYYLVDDARSGVVNMEIDRILAEWAEQSPRPVTWVRFYRWETPTVSLGKHQRPEESADLNFCRRRKIPIVTRPTGGRAVFHAEELTYAVASNQADKFPMSSITATYLAIAAALRRGLQLLGLETELASGRVGSAEPSASPLSTPCFASASRHELLWKGRKLVGSAQRRLRHSFLQQGSIPLKIDYEQMSAALGTGEKPLRSTVTSVREAAGKEIGFQALSTVLGQGFQDIFEVPLRRTSIGSHLNSS